MSDLWERLRQDTWLEVLPGGGWTVAAALAFCLLMLVGASWPVGRRR